jgi:5-methylcytosine-specific restriction endonuclease McrA
MEVSPSNIARHDYRCSRCKEAHLRGKDPEYYWTRRRRNNKKDYEKLKRKVFDHYGHQCVYCGSSKNLQLDHINGDGKTSCTGKEFYRQTITKGFPDDLQTACGICNKAKDSKTDAEYREWLSYCYHFLFKE